MLAVDTFAKASVVAAVATSEEELQQGTASALCGAFADWVFVDLIGRGQPRRAVADCSGDPACSPGCSSVRPADQVGGPAADPGHRPDLGGRRGQPAVVR